MSHNVSLSGVQFTDLSVLRAALVELQAKNPTGRYELVDTPCQVRGWGRAKTQVDAAIMCPHGSYDIGFKKNADGAYVPLLEDLFNDPAMSATHTSKTLGGMAIGKEARILGSLQQRYALVATERNAKARGMRTRRVEGADGVMQLEVTPQ